MSFANRVAATNAFIKKLEKYYWESDNIKKSSIIYFPYGYENYIPDEAIKSLKNIYTTTSKHIRYVPDFIVIRKNISVVFLLECKVIRTPRYSLKDKQWDVGQVEADAFENYMRLAKASIDIALLIYCPYHSRPLLCDKIAVNNNLVISEKTQVKSTLGSGTPYINIDLTKMSTFDVFMENYFKVDNEITNSLLDSNFYKELLSDESLKTSHHPASPYKKLTTGFNWKPRYK